MGQLTAGACAVTMPAMFESLKKLDLNLLPVLEALLEERNQTRAANRIGLSQPAISNALRRLRLFFGDELLVRDGLNYQLTPFAEELREPTRSILMQIETDLAGRPRFDPATATRVFRIACSELAAFLILRPLMASLAGEAPNVSLELYQLDGEASVRRIESGELDLGIWRSDIDPGFPKEVLYSDRIVGVVWKGLDIGPTLTTEQYTSLGLISPNLHAHSMNRLLTTAISIPRTSKNPLSVDNVFLRLSCLRGNRYVVTTQEKLARQLSDLTDTKIVELPFPEVHVSESIMWHPRKTNNPANRWLRQQLRETGQVSS